MSSCRIDAGKLETARLIEFFGIAWIYIDKTRVR